MRILFEFGRTFWAAIVNEIFERCAWYGLFSLIALYLTGPVGEGAMGFSHGQKGAILAAVPFLVYIVPTLAGTIGDKIGYKKMLMASFVVLSVGYWSLSIATGFYSFLLLFALVGIGAGMFKPMVSGTVARVARGDDKKMSVGFAVMYMMVNLGGFFGPIISGMFRPSVVEGGKTYTGSWDYVFYLSAGYMAFMFFWTLFVYVEPSKTDEDRANEKSLKAKLVEMFTDLGDKKLAALLIIFVGFWAMFNQLFITLPSWIEEWVDTSVLASFIPWDSWKTHGQLKAEMIINLDAFAIILLNVFIASLVSRFNVLKTLGVGIGVSALALAGLSFASTSNSGTAAAWILLAMVFTFAVGEMMSSPKFTELMGRIAPKDKIGTYQGYGFLSVAGGNLLAGWMSSWYGIFADKAGMYRDVLVNNHGVMMEAIQKKSTYDLGVMLQSYGVDLTVLNQQLFTENRPWMVWVIYFLVGMGTVAALYVYRRFVPQVEAIDNSSD